MDVEALSCTPAVTVKLGRYRLPGYRGLCMLYAARAGSHTAGTSSTTKSTGILPTPPRYER